MNYYYVDLCKIHYVCVILNINVKCNLKMKKCDFKEL